VPDTPQQGAPRPPGRPPGQRRPAGRPFPPQHQPAPMAMTSAIDHNFDGAAMFADLSAEPGRIDVFAGLAARVEAEIDMAAAGRIAASDAGWRDMVAGMLQDVADRCPEDQIRLQLENIAKHPHGTRALTYRLKLTKYMPRPWKQDTHEVARGMIAVALEAMRSPDIWSMIYPDVVPPVVASTMPPDGAVDVPLDIRPRAQLSEPVIHVSNPGVFSLTRTSDGAVVPGTVNYDTDQMIASIVPAAPLEPGTQYTVTLKGGPAGILDVGNGNPMAADKVWAFTTLTPPPPGQAPAPTEDA
jgi:hypothetical protein